MNGNNRKPPVGHTRARPVGGSRTAQMHRTTQNAGDFGECPAEIRWGTHMRAPVRAVREPPTFVAFYNRLCEVKAEMKGMQL